ncbi:competence protein CoiA [Mesobacillus boroniphilus]|uniref:competence protein CoiA n=1 Tax=Mesobacillus boroniphilus TaxID=308892 RepID=UPI001BCD1331
MLVANKSDGERLSLGERWEKNDLIEIRLREKFHCPECGEEVVMKLGSKKIWHFSHLAGGSCQFEYDRESEYHLSGKLKLYNWLKRQGINPKLEHFDQQMKQKPDIAFEFQNKKYAIEFQCSVIPAEIFEKRTQTYFDHGVIPIWVAAESLIKRKTNHVASINNFLYLFIRRPGDSWNIPAFCPITDQFINLHGAIPITSRKTITNFEVQSLNQLSVEELLNPTEKPFAFLKTWQTENQRLKSRYLTSPRAWQNPFLKELYRNHLSLLTLPSEIGLPVHSSPNIETPSFIWQTYLYLDVFRQYQKGDIIYYSRIRSAFDKRLRRREIKLRILPVAGQRDHWYALAEYVFLLTKVSYLERIDSGTVKVLREIIIPNSIDEQIIAEANFFTKYQNEITESIFQ